MNKTSLALPRMTTAFLFLVAVVAVIMYGVSNGWSESKYGQPPDKQMLKTVTPYADSDGRLGDGKVIHNPRGRIRVQIHKAVIQETDRAITRVAIADPEIADIQLATPRQVMVVAKKRSGTTSLIVWHGDDNALIYEVEVFVPGDMINAVRNRIHLLAPAAENVTVMAGGKGVILGGAVPSQQTLERVLMIAKSFGIELVNLISVTGSQQVQLEVKIAEISRSGAKQMGLGFLFKNDDWNVGLLPSGGVSGSLTADTSPGAPQGLSSTIDLEASFGSAFQLALQSNSSDFAGILSLLKSQGLAQMLATPTLVTMSGQEAEFLVGGEFPVPVDGGEGTTTIQFRKFGIILRFTPFVTDGETMTIQVSPEVSSTDYSLAITSGGVSVPGLKSRRGTTTLQLKDGQTFIMAGLLNEELQSTLRKVPFLGDLPLLGGLFTSKEYQTTELELIIMVTPRLVRALNPDEVPQLPGLESMDDLSDTDFFLLNQVPEPQRSSDETTAVPGFEGDTGFAR